MSKTKAAPAAETPADPAVAPDAAPAAPEAEVVAEIGDLTVLSNNTGPVIIDNTDVVEYELFQPGEEVVKDDEINGFKVIEYK